MTVSRVTLPTEFFDITSAQMLIQPEPQYVLARALFASIASAELASTGSLDLGARPPLNSGQPIISLQDQQLNLATSPLGKLVMVVNELGQKGVGHTVKLNRMAFIGGTFTEASRTIAQSTSISTTPLDLPAQEQASITIKRVAGPYSASAAAVAPLGIDRADANRSVHSLASYVSEALRRDRMKYLDAILGLLYDGATTNVVRPGQLAADASFPTSGSAPFDLSMVFRAVEALNIGNIPYFEDGRYMMLISPTQMRQLKEDPDYNNQAKEDVRFNLLTGMNAVTIGENVRAMVTTTLPTDTATIAGQTIYRGVMFGPQAVGFGIDDSCRVVTANEDNYGETAKVIWIAYEGSALLDQRFLCSMRSV